jgi:predicted lipoprotein with Yx(FWY)xxD motif
MPRLATLSVVGVVAAALAGCGGGSKAPTTTTTTGSASNPATSFSVANVSGVGNVVVDGRGRTVYLFTSTAKKNVPCTVASGCTALWPTLPLPNGTSSAAAGSGLNASLLGTMQLSDGKTYPTYNGYLMYEYAGDSARGQATGQGITSFGGTWYAISPSGQPVKQSGSSGVYRY